MTNQEFEKIISGMKNQINTNDAYKRRLIPFICLGWIALLVCTLTNFHSDSIYIIVATMSSVFSWFIFTYHIFLSTAIEKKILSMSINHLLAFHTCDCSTVDQRPENGGGDAETGEKMSGDPDKDTTEKGEAEK